MRVSAAKEICKGLREKGIDSFRVLPDGKYKPKMSDLIINWGCSTDPKWYDEDLNTINRPCYVSRAVNKRKTFFTLKAQGDINIPDFAIESYKVKKWLEEGKIVVGRELINSYSGKGILLMSKIEDYKPCNLYTLYKPKKKEFRIHVFNGKVIDAQEKRKKKGFEGTNSKIRTHNNGWVFCRQNVVLPDDAEEQAINAAQALGLVFGGIDLIWNEWENKSYILEVNSAPGIEGTTVTKYVNAIYEYLQ